MHGAIEVNDDLSNAKGVAFNELMDRMIKENVNISYDFLTILPSLESILRNIVAHQNPDAAPYRISLLGPGASECGVSKTCRMYINGGYGCIDGYDHPYWKAYKVCAGYDEDSLF